MDFFNYVGIYRLVKVYIILKVYIDDIIIVIGIQGINGNIFCYFIQILYRLCFVLNFRIYDLNVFCMMMLCNFILVCLVLLVCFIWFKFFLQLVIIKVFFFIGI